MTREAALVVMLIVAVALIALGMWAWYRRTRRDSGLVAPLGDAPAGASVVSTFTGLYVATTRHDEALERLAIKGMAFRSRVDVTVTDAGIALDLTGKSRIFIAVDRIVDVAQATVAIDRVVEKDGLVRLAWRIDDDTVVDSYLRSQEVATRTAVDTVRGILTPHQMGTDA